MRKLLLFAFALMLAPSIAHAQWDYKGSFPQDTLKVGGNIHGIAVDPDGKVWIQNYYTSDSIKVDNVDGKYHRVTVLYIFNADGTPNEMSPMKVVEFANGDVDTLGGFTHYANTDSASWETRSGRGLSTDADGNIIAAFFDTIFKIDYKTGAGLAETGTAGVLDTRGITMAVSDQANNLYVTGVFPGDPIAIYGPDLTYTGNVLDVDWGFSRGFAVSPDGNTVYMGWYDTRDIIKYERPDEFSAYDSVGVVVPGMAAESFAWQPGTNYLWISAGSPNDLPNQSKVAETNWSVGTWYAFDPADFEAGTIPTPKDSITFVDLGDGRPRAMAFSVSGDTAYVGVFSHTKDADGNAEAYPNVEMFVSAGGNAIEAGGELPKALSLSQNYPNPFRGTTNIQFSVQQSGHVSLKVYDMLGREVATLVDQTMTPDKYTVDFNASALSAGVYIYQLDVDGKRLSRKMILAK